jgi:hypothetical protein
MRKLMAAAAVAASLTGGAAAGVALFTPSLVSAQSEPAQETTPAERPTPQWMTDALQKLVDAGTITQAQADAVAQAINEAKPARGPGGPGGPGGRHHGPALAVAAQAIGIEESALREALGNGQTIAQVAQANNVDPQKVVDALVADLNTRLAQAVSEGRITQAQADEKKAGAAERFTALVNGERPTRPAMAPAMATA